MRSGGRGAQNLEVPQYPIYIFLNCGGMAKSSSGYSILLII